MSRFMLPLIAIAVLAGCSNTDLTQSPTSTYTLDNGMTVILKENHSSPMITSVLFVNAGARYEHNDNNGVTHFLEHLLFDGTQTKDRIALNETVDMYGGYINAFTREDLTAYMILMPSEYIDIGLDIQSDQLFNSIIPEHELDKERKIVIEEIKMSVDDPDYQAEEFTRQTVYKGTPYARSVLGHEEIISTIPREQILEYYRTYYMPNNMTALVIGDFETHEMLERIKRFYGIYRSKPLPQFDVVDLSIPDGKNLERSELGVKSTFVEIAMRAPHYTDPDYFAFYLLAEYLGSGDMSPLSRELTGKDSPLAQRVSAHLQTQKDFSLFHVSATTDSSGTADQILSLTESILSDADRITPSEDDLRGLVVSLKTSDIYYRERLHMYGIVIAPMMVSTGYEFLENLIPNLEKVTTADIRRVAKKYFSQVSYAGTIVTPSDEPPESPGMPGHESMMGMQGSGMPMPHSAMAGSEDEEAEPEPQREPFSYADYEKRVLRPTTGHTRVTRDEFRKETLPNGLTVVIKSTPDSRVFAVNVIGKNRSADEPEGKEGITDFVNRMLQEGTSQYSREAFASKLARIGANLTVTDNPFIPYDDRYTTQQYSFIKFETIDEFIDDGLGLLSDMLTNAAIDSESVERVRKEMLGLLARSSGSTREQCRQLFYEMLFKNCAYSKPIMGSQRSIAAITRDDLVEHYRKFYSPGNLIMTVCTNEPAQKTMEKVVALFGDMKAKELGAPSVGSPVQPPDVIAGHIPMEKEQIYIYIGGPTPGIQSVDAAALTVAGSILSDRMALELREKQGLAYSVGAGVSFDHDFGWYTAAMGTGCENFAVARDGMLNEIRKLQTLPIDPNELRKATNSLWGSQLMRNLSRINQAYYMGVDEYLGVGYDYGEKWIEQLRKVTAEDVTEVANKYFSTENYVLATAGMKLQ